jgi:hypothetical protein
MVALFAGAGSYDSPQAFVDGFAVAVVACAGLSLAGALAGAALPRRRALADDVEMPTARPLRAEAE